MNLYVVLNLTAQNESANSRITVSCLTQADSATWHKSTVNSYGKMGYGLGDADTASTVFRLDGLVVH